MRMDALEAMHAAGLAHSTLTDAVIGIVSAACTLAARRRVGDGPLLSESTLKVFVAFAIGGLLGGEVHTGQRGSALGQWSSY